MPTKQIPFNRPYATGAEMALIGQAQQRGHLAGDGHFTAACSRWLEQRTGANTALLTHSGTAALEMAAMLLDLAPGDEVIMPSYTFVSTANAFVLRGAVPVFVDVRPDTLNLDETLIEQAITDRTRAICVVHYGGVAAEIDAIMAMAGRHGLTVVEDAAHSVMASYRGRPLGSIGDFGALSFHETKNLSCGEGGALLLRDATHVERAEIIREKGTDRSRFNRGLTDKYTWVSPGSSYLLGELNAAYLQAQFEHADEITRRRRAMWDRYDRWAASHAGLQTPTVPADAQHNGHLYWLLLPTAELRDRFIAGMAEQGVHTVFHYVPLHSSPAGVVLGRSDGPLPVTDDVSGRLVRLPLWPGLEEHFDEVLAAADSVLAALR